MKKYIVRLTLEERETLSELIKIGKTAAFRILHANILLKSDADGPGWTDDAISEAFGCSRNTVSNLRERFVEEGLDNALERKPQSSVSRKPILDGEKEARLIAIGCSQPPLGRAQWTLRLLADRLVTLDVVDSVSHETVRTTLKKMS